MSRASGRLDAIGARLTQLWSDPAALQRSASWIRRAWLRVSAARGPRFASDAMRAFGEGPPTLERWDAHREAITVELEENVERLERAAQVDGEVPSAILSWLFGVRQWVEAMERAKDGPAKHARLALTRGLASRARLGPLAGDDPGETLALAGVDALLAEAAQETERVGRRRRLLEAARRVLLDAEASAPTRDGFAARRDVIAEELLHLGRLEAAGVRPDVDVSHQLVTRLRGRRADAAVTSAAFVYLRAGLRGPVPAAVTALAGQLEDARGFDGPIPDAVSSAVERGYRRAREQNDARLETAGPADALGLRRRRQHLTVDAHLSLLRMALGVDGVFDVGGGLERERVEEVSPTVDLVPYPTQELELREADGPGDVPRAIIDDPRLLVHHLATRRLLVRRYLRRGQATRERSGVRAAVRFYLLDGSTSMRGAGARMRDAILVAELASLVSRLERPSGRVRSLLYYRFFNSAAEVTRRVASIPDALEAIEEILGAARTGGTDIEGALVDSLDLIEANRASDVELSRAQIVLVTDGLAEVDPAMIRGVQERLAIPVRVSALVLGEESPALRLLAAEQRQAGLRVLYQHVPDAQLESWEHEGQRAAWPSFAAGEVAPEAIDHALDELAALSDGSEPLDLAPEALGEAYAELGLELEEGARARIEAARRDLRSLRRRFDRLFPALDADVARLPDPDDLEATLVLDALGVVAEVLALSCSDELTARSDAIAIFERLLQDRGLTPARYLALAREHPDRVGPAVDAVRALTGAR
ncbi:MAG: hypothetical protein SangKO_038520 [Sandaracinaceae bacterium]